MIFRKSSTFAAISSMALDQYLVTEIKDVIDLICIFQARAQALVEDFNFFKNELKANCPGLKRLEHEVMFLCIDMDALHKGLICENRSFYSRVILLHGEQLSKVDKNSTFDTCNTRNFMNDDAYCLSLEELQEMAKESSQETLQARKNLKKESGVPSKNHKMISEEWRESFLKQTEDYISKISALRDVFAHRTWELPRFQESYMVDLKRISEILECSDQLLKIYKDRFQVILGYCNSESYESGSYSYDSLSRIREAHKYLKKTHD
jgi:hypothetical protein